MARSFKDAAVRWCKWPERVGRYLLVAYSAFISVLSLVYSSASSLSGQHDTSLNVWQDMSIDLMQQIGWIVLAGCLIAGLFFISSIAIGLSRHRLHQKATASPCIGSLLKGAHAAITDGGFLELTCRITLYKAVGDKRLVFFASAPAVLDGDSSFRISREDENRNEGLLGECWHVNLNMRKERNQRTPKYSLRNQTPNAKAEIVLPVIVSEHDKSPWGVICIRSRQTLKLKVCQHVIEKLNANSGLVATLENLFEQQRNTGHFIRFAK